MRRLAFGIAAGVLLAAAVALAQDAREAAPATAEGAQAAAPATLEAWLDAIAAGLGEVERLAAAGRVPDARRAATRLYLDHYEPIEGYFGAGGTRAAGALPELVARGEARFHQLLLPADEPADMAAAAAALRTDIEAIRAAGREEGLLRTPVNGQAASLVPADSAPDPSAARTPEVRAILERLAAAREAYRAGDADAALATVELAYLEGFEPLEPRLPAANTGAVERSFHLVLRPAIARRSDVERVDAAFAALGHELIEADRVLDSGATFWFGAVNAFVIILREGLEAVLLIAALLAYLGAIGAGARHRRQIYAGLALGIAASIATWIAARTIIPIGGASRELIEGVTALIAVGVLLYVSHWLFQKTYIHDWKTYLRDQVGQAVSRGSSLAMAGLAFAAVYREGFETVLFYQALLFDSGSLAVLTGFLPGIVLIAAIGVAIVRLGLRLPLRKVFAATNAILLYLAFVFLGKGLYNLQEAGLFSPHPLSWIPDHQALRLLLGLYPAAETLAAQALFLLAIAATYLLYRRRAAATTPAAAPVPARAPGTR